MWLVFGVLAIIATFINLYQYRTGKDNQLAMALGLSFTALTLAAQFSMMADALKAEDWAGLLDVVPTMSTALWMLTILSIVLNITPVLLGIKNKAHVP